MEDFHKMPSVKRSLFCASCIAMCVMFLLGCVSSAQKRSDQDASLVELAEQYWTKRLVELDYKFTFNLELEKDSLSFSEYCEKVKRSQRFNCSSVKIKEVIIEDDKGIVYLNVECCMPFLSKPYALPINDVWLYESNRWKHKFTHK
jgi:outer membrane lipoprotein-sorting protein